MEDLSGPQMVALLGGGILETLQGMEKAGYIPPPLSKMRSKNSVPTYVDCRNILPKYMGPINRRLNL